MKFWIQTAAVAVGIVLASAAAAQDEVARLQRADANGDQVISQTEARSAAQQQFAHLDRDHDGQLSEAEFVDARLAGFSEADSNGDGQLSRGEMRARLLSLRQR